MPTAAELRAEADSLDRALDALAATRIGLDRDRRDVGVRGGVALLVDRVLATAVDGADELARLVTALADELRRRAVLCEQYTAEVRRHADELHRWRAAVHRYRATGGADQPWPGPAPMPPTPPFPGAAAG